MIGLSFSQGAFAGMPPPAPVILSPTPNSAVSSPSFDMVVTVPGLPNCNDIRVEFKLINPSTGDTHTIFRQSLFSCMWTQGFSPDRLRTEINLDPMGTFALEVTAVDENNGMRTSTTNGGLTVAPPPDPIVILPLPNTAQSSPSFPVEVRVPTDQCVGFIRIDYTFTNTRTGDSFTDSGNLLGNECTNRRSFSPQTLLNNFDLDPRIDTFDLKVTARSVNTLLSSSTTVGGLSIAPPPAAIVFTPLPNSVVDAIQFSVQLIVPTDECFVIRLEFTFTNPRTGDSHTFPRNDPGASDCSFSRGFNVNTIVNAINLDPNTDSFDMQVTVIDLNSTLETSTLVEGLTLVEQGCPLPNGSTTTIFGGVIISQGNQDPVADFVITGFKFNQPITLDGSASFDFDQPSTIDLEFMWEVTDLAGNPVSVDDPMAEITFFTPTSTGRHEITLIVTDVCGATGTQMEFVTVKNNLPPTADAGEDQNRLGNIIILVGSGDDPDGDNSALSFLWQFKDIPPRPPNIPTPTFDNPNSKRTTFDSRFVKGVYTIELTVFDPEGSFDTDEVIITINIAPIAIATATPDMVIPDQDSILDGSQSFDRDGDLPLTFLWEITGIPEGVTTVRKIVNPTSEMAMFSQGPTSLGAYVVKLTVTDTTGRENLFPDEVTITVIPDTNVPPTVRIGQTKTTFTEGASATFTATATDPEDGNLSNQIDWKFRDRDSGTTLFMLMNSNTFTIQNLPIGTFRVEVEIRDSRGSMDIDFRNIEVVPTENKKSTNVPSGQGSSVNQQVGLNGINSINFGFDEVVQEGTIETLLGQLGPTPPNGFTIVSLGFGPQTYLNLSFDGSFTGNVEICVNYDDSGLGLSEEQSLHMQHFNENPGLWEDITKNLDTVLNNLCGETDTLSPLAIMSPLVVGGELIPIDTTSLLLAGTYSTAAWLIPVIVSGIGFAIVIARKF